MIGQSSLVGRDGSASDANLDWLVGCWLNGLDGVLRILEPGETCGVEKGTGRCMDISPSWRGKRAWENNCEVTHDLVLVFATVYEIRDSMTLIFRNGPLYTTLGFLRKLNREIELYFFFTIS